MTFDTPILTRAYSRNVGPIPQMADREFWSPVVMDRPSTVTPDIIYTFITSAGDRLVDNSSNPLIAVT
ncbi:MAG: hypothetical protein EBR82_10415 [Caulobacteraceae bacterium]|nr:hypothetical protein [Caulobacteraceae bacterium]